MLFRGNLTRTQRYFFFYSAAASFSICRAMSAEIISPSSTSPEMSSATCGPFLSVEFTIFLFVFLAGLVSNVLFFSVSFKRLVNVKGYSHKPNVYLVHWCIANLILLVFNMPFDVISFSASGFWFFGEDLCRLREVSFFFFLLSLT